MDLFDDLPEPQSSPCDKNENSNLRPLSNTAKRKPEDTPVLKIQGTKKHCHELFTLKSFVKERRGERDEMQDAYAIVEQLDELIMQRHSSVCRVSYYGVFDGHAGTRASQYASKHLHLNIASYFPKGDIDFVEKEIKKCFIEAHKKTDDDFLKIAAKSKPSWKDGTTAVSVTVVNNILFIANLGDSKAVLARFNEETQKLIALPLTVDHNPTQYEERMRIQRAGGFVREGRVMGILEVSRSIGDGQFKTSGLTCIPDVKRCQITNHDRFLILACDGLWKIFTPTEAVNLVDEMLQVPSDERCDCSLESERDTIFVAACLKLANEAVRKGSGDNITVLLITINEPS